VNKTPQIYLRNDLYDQIIKNKQNVSEYVNNVVMDSLSSSPKPKQKKPKPVPETKDDEMRVPA